MTKAAHTDQDAKAAFDTRTINLNFPTEPDRAKQVSTLKAKFALAGHQVYGGSDNDFIVCRLGMSRYCESVAALRAFLRQIGGVA